MIFKFISCSYNRPPPIVGSEPILPEEKQPVGEKHEEQGKDASKREPSHRNQPGTLAQAILDNLYYVQGRPPELATRNDWYMALAYTVRDRLLHNWVQTLKTIREDVKVVSYLSAEFLLGPQLGNNLINLGIWEQVREARVTSMDSSWRTFSNRRASPVWETAVWAGWPPATWTPWPPWRFPPSATASATNSASSTRKSGTAGRWRSRTNGWNWAIPGRSAGRRSPIGWAGRATSKPIPTTTASSGGAGFRGSVVKGVAHDYPVPGYRNRVTDLLRLWKAEAVESFEFADFNVGDYYGAVQEKVYLGERHQGALPQ